MLVSQSIPNLIGGISQQPPEFRRRGQCNDAINTYSDPVAGVKKRSGSEYVATLPTIDSSTFFGFIERDSTEEYIFALTSNLVRVWSVDGIERTVNAPNGFGYLSGTTNYRFLTVSDTTFIVNPNRTVEKGASLSPASTASGLIFIRAVDYDTTYKVTFSGSASGSAQYTTPSSGTLSTEAVASSLASQLLTIPGITSVTYRGPVIRYTINGDYDLDAFTTFGVDYIIPIPGVAESIGDLPVIGWDGVVIKISPDPTTNADDYFVRFTGNGNGVWTETVAPGILNSLDASTMPHVLISEADGTFTFKQFEWSDRVVGDDDSNPYPSFVGERITNVLYERDRLGFLSDVNIILSAAKNLSNFFRTTVVTIIDSDVIDRSASGQQVDRLQTSIGVRDGVLLFSDQSQFLLNTGDADILSPETANITSVSSYKSDTLVEPRRVGDSILFVTNRDQKSGVREYMYDGGASATQSSSITNHIPSLLPSTLRLITGSSTENIVFFLSNFSTTLYCYQYLYDGQEKVISSWVKWNFNDALIRFGHVFDDYLYIILVRDGVTQLERVPLSNSFVQPNFPGEVCLDEYQTTEGVPRTFNGTGTTFVIPREFSVTPTCVIASPDEANNFFTGDTLDILSISTQPGETSITFPGDVSSLEFLVGTPYLFFYEMSTQFLQKEGGDVEIEGRFQVRNVTFALYKTGFARFRVVYNEVDNAIDLNYMADVLDMSEINDMSLLTAFDVDDLGGYVYSLSTAYPDSNLETRLNQITDTFRVPVNSVNTGFTLSIESPGWQPLILSKAIVEAMFYKRSRNVG